MKIKLVVCVTAVLGMIGCDILAGGPNRGAGGNEPRPVMTNEKAGREQVVARFVPEQTNKPQPNHPVIFRQGQIAFAIGDYYYLSRTTDGGRSWQLLVPASDDETLFGGKFRDIVVSYSFHTPTRGWMIVRSPSRYGTWQTDDSGETWRLISADIFDGFNFFNENEGWTNRCDKGGKCQSLLTRDGGDTWHSCGTLRSGDRMLGPAHFVSQRLGWSITTANDEYGVARTTDGGCNWTKIWESTAELDDRFCSIYFLNEHEGWLGGCYSGSLGHTTNGGTTWRSVRRPTQQTKVSDIYFRNSKEGWIVDAFQDILHTMDGGRTWRKLSIDEIRANGVPAEWTKGQLLRPVE